MSFNPINPKPFLKSLINRSVIVKLKSSNVEYHGFLLSVDNYMNLSLDSSTKEFDPITEELTPLGSDLFIRCNNVLWISTTEEHVHTSKAQ
ncbi:Core Sm protein Sm F, spliceosomal U1, U2, U4, and U5 snRNPs component [Komagataella phaffii CBS 7435]|uniref:Sm protein F n=2 Tax=Komagataella phaffii TaxID=460519 RepID=C4R1V6_KOMPG|nr:Core Sm protein Sm F [Komagataella phaffii GS115]CAH2447981.1 Core Sm protein Sm F, spliceosomal U1, U2, U4, and U5 snRNPs component [Komagataella phaffii CBS 7435]CAY69480.1 Core Sm protein Sm F [Komagataella phaffii GS115]SCV12020.1 Core Sm protein Sm F, spliceosomal U1, U2, U4, and U5 snRNPs component [Komagataella phaffii CBS 7435]